MRKADLDMAVLPSLLEHGEDFAGHVGFHSQQAAEKYLKALLTYRQIEFPKTHDIERLLSLLVDHGELLPEELEGASILTAYGVNARYPSTTELTAKQAREAIELASMVRDFVKPKVR